MKNILVSISCLTFNHEKYIKQTIDSFLMQKTNFKFEILIHDDASTDNTATIIKEYEKKYPTLFRCIYQKENQYSQGIRGIMSRFNFPRAKGKYIALCEGDDYWTDPLKLQKQIDFLENNEEFGLVHAQMNKLFDATNKIIPINKDRSKTSFVELLKENPIVTLTTVMRKDLLLKYMEEVQPQTKKWIAGDTPMWLWFSLHSKIHFLDEIMATYRVCLGSMSNVIGSEKYLDYIKSRLSIRKFFVDKYFSSKKEYLNIIHKRFYKDAEYHALKIKEKDIIDTISLEFKKNKMFIKSAYFHLMSKLIKYNFIYTLLFLVYRISYKLKNDLIKTSNKKNRK